MELWLLVTLQCVVASWGQSSSTDLDPEADLDYILPSGITLQDGAAFDYVVVGAGASGSALAARLALAGKDVLLIEAGSNPPLLSKVPGLSVALLGSTGDYQYDTISNNASCLAYRKQQCRFSRGRGLGGSTNINDMMHTRGHPLDFDELNVPGWAWKDIEPHFLRYEGLRDLAKLPPQSAPYHNTTGPMKMQLFSDPRNPWHSRIREGFEQLNVPFNPDVNGESKVGVTQVVGYVYKNERMGTAKGYLSRQDVRECLKVAKLTTCTGVVFDENNQAQGVTVTHGLFKKKMTIRAKKEVILSAGALVTPQLLMLSGIGPAEHLKQFNIPVRVDLPVGNNLNDHVLPTLLITVDPGTGIAKELREAAEKVGDIAQLLMLKKGPLTSIGLTDMCAFINSECYDYANKQLKNDSPKCDVPDLQFIHSYTDRNIIGLAAPLFKHATDLDDPVVKQLIPINAKYALIVISPLLLKPYSLGSVRLASNNPNDPPAIFPNYLSDKRDVDLMVRAITIVEDLMETPAFKNNNASIVKLDFPDCPSYESDRIGYWSCYSRHMTRSGYHSTGTTSLGGVVSAGLRVRGVRGLRACDLGVLPRVPRGNTAAAAIALAERLAQIILDETQE